MARDLSRSQAILIGSGRCQDPRLDALPADDCIKAVNELLQGELCGWPPDRVTVVPEPAAPSELARKVLNAERDAQDVLLVYFVGHGLRTRTGKLALVLRETDLDPEALPHTAMLYAALADILRGCPATTKLVILDCCHAELGDPTSDLFQGGDLADAYPVDGLYFIGASKRDEKAKYPEDGHLTYFTQALIDVVRNGIRGQPEELRLDQIFLELRRRLASAGLPEPVDAGIRDARQFPFARNAAWLGLPEPEARPRVNTPAVPGTPVTVSNSKDEMRNTVIGLGTLIGFFGFGVLEGLLSAFNPNGHFLQNGTWFDNFEVALWLCGPVGAVFISVMFMIPVWVAARTTSDTLTLDDERLAVRRWRAVRTGDNQRKEIEITYSVEWSALKRIRVEGKGRNAVLRAWFRPDRQPPAEWLKKNRVRRRRDGSFVIYGPVGPNPGAVKADRLCGLLPRYAGHLYDGPEP
jgi:hypothetical protein